MRTSFSTVVGGGACGKGDGIARGTIIQGGAIMATRHVFIEGYHQIGEMTIEIIVGKGIIGTTNEYLTNKFKRTDVKRPEFVYTLVIFLSMVFWGWVPGPIGMILPASMTSLVKIVLESYNKIQGLAIMMGSDTGN